MSSVKTKVVRSFVIDSDCSLVKGKELHQLLQVHACWKPGASHSGIMVCTGFGSFKKC